MRKLKNAIERKGLPGGPNEMVSYMSELYSTEGYKRNSPDKNRPYNIIPSGNITMKGVDFPVLGTDNLGNSQMMMPGYDYKFPGNEVFEIPMAQDGGEQNENPAYQINLRQGEYVQPRQEFNTRDFTITQKDLEFMNDNYACYGHGCLGNAFQSYDKAIGKRFPSYIAPSVEKIKSSLGVQSLPARINNGPGYDWDYSKRRLYYYDDKGNKKKVGRNEQKRLFDVPYFDVENNDFTMDSWDVHGVIVDKGGKNLWTSKTGSDFLNMPESKRVEMLKKLPIGAIVGYGSNSGNRSYNTEKGLYPSNHSAIVVGYDDKTGLPILFDNKRFSIIGNGFYDLNWLTNISVPKIVEGKTPDWLDSMGFLYRGDTKPLNLDYEALKEGRRFKHLDKFYKTLQEIKGDVVNTLWVDDDEYDEIAANLLALAMQETKGGKSRAYRIESLPLLKFGDTIGLTQLNIDNIKKDAVLGPIAKAYGINKKGDLSYPRKSAIASMLYGVMNNRRAKLNYEAGLSPSERTFSPPKGWGKVKTLIQDVDSTYDGINYKIDSEDSNTGEEVIIPIKLPTTNNIVGMPRESFIERDLKKVQEDFDKVAPGIFKVTRGKNGKILVNKQTRGNADLPDSEKFFYNWQSPYSLKSGDARGKSLYMKKGLERVSKIKKKQTGGESSNWDEEMLKSGYNLPMMEVTPVDKRLSRLRNLANPFQAIQFRSKEGRWPNNNEPYYNQAGRDGDSDGYGVAQGLDIASGFINPFAAMYDSRRATLNNQYAPDIDSQTTWTEARKRDEAAARNLGPIIPLLEFMPQAKLSEEAGSILSKLMNKKNTVDPVISKPQFISEIDWAKWNPDTPNYKVLMDEYNAIEESTKKAGTWMKNPDGSDFKGTPEQFIQQQSSWFKKAYPEGYYNTYRGVTAHNSKMPENRAVFTANKDLAKNYAFNKDADTFGSETDAIKGGLYEFYGRKTNKDLSFDALDQFWDDIILFNKPPKLEGLESELNFISGKLKKAEKHYKEGFLNKRQYDYMTSNLKPEIDKIKYRINNIDNLISNPAEYSKLKEELGDYVTTDNIASYLERTDLDDIELRNIDDGGFGNVKIVNNRPGNYLKSTKGNVGFFDLNDSNPFKMLIPPAALLGASYLSNQNKLEEKQTGGEKSFDKNDFKIYRKYVDGKDTSYNAERIYNRLNAYYKDDAKQFNSSVPVYILNVVAPNI